MDKILHIILISLFSLTIYSCSSSSDTASSTCSDNSTSSDNSNDSDNSTSSDSCSSVNDGFIKYDSSGTAVSDCTASWEAVILEDMSLMVEYKSSVSADMDRIYADAVVYCAALSKAGFTDWKVPAQANLKTIITVASTAVNPNNYYYLPYINPNKSNSNYAGYSYWSSEEYDNDSQKTVEWRDTAGSSNDKAVYITTLKTDLVRIICVRDSN